MGYLLFADALGIKNYYDRGVDIADPIINRIAIVARNVFGSTLPDLPGGMLSDKSSHLVVMNDSVFVYSEKLEHVIYFASKFLKSMFMPERKVDPIAFRGAIAETKSFPKITLEQKRNMSITKIIIDNISAAMIAEKKKITGARILVPKYLITDVFLKSLDLKYQYLLMDLEKSLNNVGHALFTNDYKDYYDVAWMIGKDKIQDVRIKENVIQFWERSVFNERASLHSSAMRALLHACQVKKRSLLTVFQIHCNKYHNQGILKLKLNKNTAELFQFVNALSSVKNKIAIPLLIRP